MTAFAGRPLTAGESREAAAEMRRGRKAAGMSMAALASALGVSTFWVASRERGEARMNDAEVRVVTAAIRRHGEQDHEAVAELLAADLRAAREPQETWDDTARKLVALGWEKAAVARG